MKLTIIRLQQLSEQDRIDLKKIWPLGEPASLADGLNENHQLYAARFNDRLLAAARVEIQGTSGKLHQFNVREVTRRRGVGSYLLEEIQAQNPAVQHWAVASDGDGCPATIAAFMQVMGFRRESDEWVKSLG